MSRAPLSPLLVLLLLTTSWAAALSAFDADPAPLPRDESADWTASEAAEHWFASEPVRLLETEITPSSGIVSTVMGEFDPLFESEPEPSVLFRDSLDVEATRLLIVQLVEHDHTTIEELCALYGMSDLDHIPDSAYLLRLPVDATAAATAVEAIDDDPRIRWWGVQHPGWRLEPALLEATVAAVAGESVPPLDIDLTIASDVGEAGVPSLIADLKLTTAEVVHCDAWLCQIRGIDASWLPVLARDGRILFTEAHSPIGISNNYARNLARIDTVVNNWNGGLDGTGEVAGVSDTGLDADHGDFTNRVRAIYNNFGPDNSAEDGNSGHGTHISGTLLGDGSGDSSTMGIAPETTFHFYQLEHDQSGQMARYGSLYSMFQHSFQQSAHVQTNSWGAQSSGGQYSSDSRSADTFMDDYSTLLVLFAAGNEGSQGSSSVSPPSTAKNVISVGASTTGRPGTASAGQVASFSSQGSTLDGRIKPDIVAPGVQICSARADEAQFPAGPSCSSARHSSNNPKYMSADGSSASTPVVAGASVMVRQFLREEKAINSARSDLVKAIIINGALDMGSADVPNQYEGWGQLDLERSIYPHSGILALNTFFDYNQTLTPGYSYLYTYDFDGSYGVSITLVWNDREGSASASQSSPRLVTDLDLVVTAPDGTVYRGNSFVNGFSTTGGSADTLNNVERVKLGSTQSGNWSIQVSNSGGHQQGYSVVVTGMGAENQVSDLTVMSSSLWCSVTEPLEGDLLLIGGTWVNQAPAITSSYRVTVEDVSQGLLLRNETRGPLAGGTSDSIVFTHTFGTTGIHHLQLTLDVDDDVPEPNDQFGGTNNNVYSIYLNVSAIGVRLTPYLESGQLPTGDAELSQASSRILDPTVGDSVDFQMLLANEGTSAEDIDLRVSTVQYLRPDGIYDAPEDEWLRFLSLEPYYILDPLGGANDSILLTLTLRDESADLDAEPYPLFPLPGTYIVDVSAWYRSNPLVQHTVRLTVVVDRVEMIYTVLAGTVGLGAQPGTGAIFSLSVLNLGNGPSVYNISCETPNRWSVELGDGNSSSITLEPLARLQFLPVTVRVNVPPVVDGLPAAGTKESISCTTTHTGASGMSTTESTEIEVFVSQDFSVDLYSSTGVPVGVWGNPLDEAVSDGQRLNLTLDIVNKGNVPLELDVTVTPEQTTWPLGLFCGEQDAPRSLDLILAPGSSAYCRIEVQVPQVVSDGAQNEVVVRTQLSPGEFIQNRTTLVVEERPDLELSAPESGLVQVTLGSLSTTSFKVDNIGNTDLTLAWETGTVPEGWSVGFHQLPPTVLGMHRQDDVIVSVVLPPATGAGIQLANIPVIVTGTTPGGDEVVRTAQVGVEVLPTAWVNLSSDRNEFQRIEPEQTHLGNLTVSNHGNVPCRVDLSVSAPEGWTVDLSQTMFQVMQPGENSVVPFTVTVERGADGGPLELRINATVTATEGTPSIDSSLILFSSSSELVHDGGLLTYLDDAGVPSWAIGLATFLLMLFLVAGFMMLRRSTNEMDPGEEIITAGMGGVGSFEQRREAALDTGLTKEDHVSGSVSADEIQEALDAADPTSKLGLPKPPGPPPPPPGAPPGF